jgi:MOSC domain-containing protein YiiM
VRRNRSARVVSVNVGRPREIDAGGEIVLTSIFKNQVSGPVQVRRLNLDGDEQSDLSVHGGVNKAVYAYPSEHYVFWQQELSGPELPWGAFGENLTTEGLLESAIRIGDRFRIGTAECVVTQPRMPCFKLALKFGRPDMIRRFLKSGRSGFYLSVAQEGEVSAGDAIAALSQAKDAPTIAEILRSRES